MGLADVTLGWNAPINQSVHNQTSISATVTPQQTTTYSAFVDVLYGNDHCIVTKNYKITVQQ